MAASSFGDLAQPTAAGQAAEPATETLLLDLSDDLVEQIVSKLPAAESCAIRSLASTSHRMLRIVLESCSCLKCFDTWPNWSLTLTRCLSRLDFNTAGIQPSRARMRGTLMPGDAPAEWDMVMPLYAMALVCAKHWEAYNHRSRTHSYAA
jgi:hypothetical protein